jgi:hypothetical protein
MKITFKADNATQLDAEHPSMRVSSRKRARHFKVCYVPSDEQVEDIADKNCRFSMSHLKFRRDIKRNQSKISKTQTQGYLDRRSALNHQNR